MWIDKIHAGTTRMFNEVQLHVTDILLVAVSISLHLYTSCNGLCLDSINMSIYNTKTDACSMIVSDTHSIINPITVLSI